MRKKDRFMEQKRKAIKILTRAASMLKAMSKSEISFEEFEKEYKFKRKFLKAFKTTLKKFASRPIKFLDPEGEVLIYVNLQKKCFNIRRLRE